MAKKKFKKSTKSAKKNTKKKTTGIEYAPISQRKSEPIKFSKSSKKATTTKKNRTMDYAPISQRKSEPKKIGSKSETRRDRTSDYAPISQKRLSNRNEREEKLTRNEVDRTMQYAPITLGKAQRRPSTQEGRLYSESGENSYLKRSKAFDDKSISGFDAFTKTLAGTMTDISENSASVSLGIGEQIADTLAYLGSSIYIPSKVEGRQPKTHEQMKEEASEFIKKDLYDEEKIAKQIITNPALKRGVDAENNSIFGEKSDALIQSGGQLIATAGLQAVGVPWWLTTGATSFGGEAENALNEGASYDEAGGSALISAGAEILTEKLSGGIKFGGKTLDDALLEPLTRRISSKGLRTLTKLGVDTAGEGAEEVLSSIFSNLGTSLYKEETPWELLTNEEAMDEYIDSFIGGMVLGGGSSGIGAVKANKSGKDFATGLSDNELKVVQKEIENRSKDALDKKIQTQKKKKLDPEIRKAIEDMKAIHGKELTEEQMIEIRDSVKSKSNISDDAFSDTKLNFFEKNKISDQVMRDMERGEIDLFTIADTLYRDGALKMRELNNEKKLETTTPERKAEIDEELNQLQGEFDKLIGGSKLLQESYVQNELKSEKLDYKLDENASEKAKKIVESAVRAGENNTRKAHEKIDLAIKIAEDSDLDVEFVNDEQLELLGHYKDTTKLKASLREAETDVEREQIQKKIDEVRKNRKKKINGVKTEDNRILINVNSSNAIQTIIGHEVTHVTEKAGNYNNLKDVVMEYAKSIGDYGHRLNSTGILYKSNDSTITSEGIEQEVVADIVGEYVFTDEDFVRDLSVKEPSTFESVRDYIKHVFKMATAGSSEARQLEQAKRMFEKVYRETASVKTDSKSSKETNTETKLSISPKLHSDLRNVRNNTFDSSKSEVYIGKTSDFLVTELEAEELEMLMPAKKAYSAMVTEEEAKAENRYNANLNYHGLGEDKLLEALTEAERPIIAYASNIEEGKKGNKREDRIVLVTEAKLNDEYIVVVNGVSSEGLLNGKRIKSNSTVTVYDKNNIVNHLKEAIANNRILFVDKKRSHLIGKGEEVQFLNSLNDNDFKKNIADFWANVNYKKKKTKIPASENIGNDIMANALKRAMGNDAVAPVRSDASKFSLSEDAEQTDNYYLKAVNDGDVETAQKMVDEVAKKNGYDIVVYHGTNAEKIDVFAGSPDRMEINAPNLIKGYFSDQESYANDYGENTFKYYIKSEDFLYIEPMFDSDEMTEYLEKHGVTDVEYNDFISDDNAVADWMDMYSDVIDPWMFFNENGGNITERIREAGYKGVCWSEGYMTEGDGMAYMPFESSLIKSADTVTYDDNGNVIPLSKRFDVENDDIRYSLSEDELNSSQDEYAPLYSGYAPLTEAEANERDANHFRESTKMIDDIAPTKEMPKVKDATEDEEIAEVLDTVPKTEKQKNKRKWAIFAANVFDKGFVFENLSLKTKNRELMGKWNSTLYSESRAQRLIGSGNQESFVKSLNSIRETVEGAGLSRDFQLFMYHRHNVDRMRLKERYGTENKPVFGNRVTAEMSQRIVDEYLQKHPEFAEYAEDVYAYNNHLRNELVRTGVISEDTAKLWQEMYPHYVPVRRVDDVGADINVPLDTNRTGINAPIKKATGGNSNILPLFDTMAMRTLQTYRASAKNSFGVELKNTLGSNSAKSSTSIEEVLDGIDFQEDLLQEGKRGRKPTFTVFENGEKVTFEITDDMYDALKPLSESSLLSKTIKPFNIASNVHRGLLTEYNPVFMLTNAIKDVQDVLINSQHSLKTYQKIPEAFMQMKKKGYWYNEYMENGGEQNSYFNNEDLFDTDPKGASKLLEIYPLRKISEINNFIEMIPRLSEYIASREMGRSVEVSMLDSARVTTNFRAGGDLTKFINRNGGTFLNASVQGAMQQVRNVREANANGLKGWANLATKFLVAGIPAFVLNNMIWDDDDDYEELSDYVKQNYYIVWKYDDNKFIRIPKGRTVAVIQETLLRMTELATGDDEKDLKTYLDTVIDLLGFAKDNLAPNNPFDNNIIAPIRQALTNTTWYGEDLVPENMQNIPAGEQYDESTDVISKFIGEHTGTSPMKWNYVLDQYSGGIGDVFLPMLTPEVENNADSLVDYFIAPVKDKFTTDSVMNNQNVSDFYELKDELEISANSAYATDTDKLRSAYAYSVSNEMGKLYAEKRSVQNSKMFVSDKAKYEKLRQIQSKIDRLAEEGMDSYMDSKIYGRYATVGDRQFLTNEKYGWSAISEEEIEKQEKASALFNISAKEYWANDDDKYMYDWAVKYPQYYQVSRAISTDIGTYWKHNSHIWNNINADKDANGKWISGTKKKKIIAYINSLTDLSYEGKLILYKKYYPADDTYNMEIINYLNSRNDISYDEMKTILEELEFKVDSRGNISW